ncbi:recombinase family protein [Gemmata sp. G18]|uniref:Recombinase family protein n=1 Tax=Gemmata palustris TaxID=2822762 RepID=A0ABS5BVP8_9BACT|nr:recombinase family protein [Gemmata palustris]MBP3957789.1 recombinase family protein [Gemmata palustris]
MALAYSYLRFSSPQQAEGDSLRRQTESREKWLASHPEIQLDTSLLLEDRGRSAFKRRDWDTYALAAFLRHVESSRVAAGSYLLVENLDRLSREHIRTGVKLFIELLDQKINIVTLTPEKLFRHDSLDLTDIIIAVVELSRGHSESAVKSARCREAWEQKNKEARTCVVTKRLPGWIRQGDDGRLVLDQAAAKIVRRAFDLARDGYSVIGIAKLFNSEKVPVLGRKTMPERGEKHKPKGERKQKPVMWSQPTLYGILTSRAAIGEYVPYQTTKRPDKPVGEAVPGYYPAVVDEDTFHAVRAALAVRAKVGRGRRGKHINLFAGLLRDARDGGAITYCHRRDSCELVPVSVKQNGTQTWASFPAVAFEDAILSKLKEVQAADVEGDRGEARRKVEAIAGEHTEAEQNARRYKVRCDGAKTEEEFNLFADKAVEWDRKRVTLATDLEHAQREAASPLSESWGEFRSLAELLAEDKSDDLRIRARAALRRAVESVHCLFVGKRVRLAAVRIQFHGDCHREYLISYTPGRSNKSVKRPGQWAAESFADAGLAGRADLSNQSQAKKFELLLVKHTAKK